MKNLKALTLTAITAIAGFAGTPAMAADPSLCDHLYGGAYRGCMGLHSTGDVYGVNGGTPTHPRAPQAQAAPVDNGMTVGQTALVNALDKAGIPVHFGECGRDDFYGLFFYEIGKRGGDIAICSEVATTSKAQWETLRHEATHAAQNCLNPDMSQTMVPKATLDEYASEELKSWIKDAYEAKDYWIEVEAFLFEKESNSEVAKVVEKFCF